MRPVSSLLALLFVTLSATSANADVAPPDGSKRLAYTFTLKGLASAPDQAVFAYSCGAGGGAPMAQHQLMVEGKAAPVGRHYSKCALYTIAKTSYDDWAKTYTPTYKFEDPALDALAAKSTKCSGAPSPLELTVKSSDPRTSIDELLEVTKLTATECVVVSTNKPQALPETSPTNPTNPTNPTDPTTGATSQASDDGGCNVGAANTTGPWLLALAVPALFLLSSRRRKKQA